MGRCCVFYYPQTTTNSDNVYRLEACTQYWLHLHFYSKRFNFNILLFLNTHFFRKPVFWERPFKIRSLIGSNIILI